VCVCVCVCVYLYIYILFHLLVKVGNALLDGRIVFKKKN
jgi:hypothetical protein